jgi:hypothetical protein
MRIRMMPHRLLIVATTIVILLAHCGLALAEQERKPPYTDRIHLKNGDVITGNIKELDRGKLRLKTLTMDTVFINWVDIESIDSPKYLRIERVDGTFNYGVIEDSDLSKGLVVDDRGSKIGVPILDVSTIQPIRTQESFWRRLEGNLKAGIDYKKASDILLVNLSTDVRFRREKYQLAFDANWNETSRTANNDSLRADCAPIRISACATKSFARCTGT